MNTHTVALACVLVATAIASYTDIRTRRIPNVISATLLVSGLALTILNGWQHAAISVGLFLAVFAFGTLLFSFNFMGGGDVKLLAAAAAALGWPDTALFLVYTILAGGLLGIATAVARRRLRPMLANVRTMLFPMFAGVRPASLPSAVGPMPYGVAIFAGAITLALGDLFGLALRF